jgi:hypothetical protein
LYFMTAGSRPLRAKSRGSNPSPQPHSCCALQGSFRQLLCASWFVVYVLPHRNWLFGALQRLALRSLVLNFWQFLPAPLLVQRLHCSSDLYPGSHCHRVATEKNSRGNVGGCKKRGDRSTTNFGCGGSKIVLHEDTPALLLALLEHDVAGRQYHHLRLTLRFLAQLHLEAPGGHIR